MNKQFKALYYGGLIGLTAVLNFLVVFAVSLPLLEKLVMLSVCLGASVWILLIARAIIGWLELETLCKKELKE